MPSKDQWNERFLAGEHSRLEPDPFVVACADYWELPSTNTAADLASGAGRHALYLAELGFQTTAIDFAQAGLDVAQARARDRGLPLQTEQVDLEADGLDLGLERFDLIVVVHFLHRPLFPAIKHALKPGGWIVYKTYTADQLALPEGPKNPAYVLQPNELLREFSDYRVLRYEERTGGEGTAAVLAQKPPRTVS